jgi:DNA recombination-dependent growth factor C
MGMLVAKSSVDQQNFLGDLREVMQEITNSATAGSEKAAAEITAQLRKTVGDLTLPTTVSKDPNVIDLRRTMQDQNSLQEMSVRQQYEMLSVLNEMRSIQQQILSNST